MVILTRFQLLQPSSLLLPLSCDSFSVLIFDFLPQNAALKIKQIPTTAFFRIFCQVLVHSRPGRRFSHEEGVKKKGSNAKDGVGAGWSTRQVVASAHFQTSQQNMLVR